MNTVTNAIEILQGPSSSASLPCQIMSWSCAVVVAMVAILLTVFVAGVIVSFVREEILDK